MKNIFTNEDCMEVMARYPDNHFDLAIVDPPFGIGADWEKRKRSKRLHEGKGNYRNESIPSAEYFAELFRVSKDQIIWGYNYYAHYIPLSNNIIVWNKITDYETSFMSEGELAWTSVTKFPLRIFDHSWSGARKGKETGCRKIHPHQKPTGLYKWLLSNYANEGDLILDTHVGSASSLIACEDKGFNYVGCELDPDYFRDANERLAKFRSEPKLPFNIPSTNPSGVQLEIS